MSPVQVKVTLRGSQQLDAALRRISPANAPQILSRSLRKIGLQIAKVAKDETIIRGGRQRPHPTKLTSRSGTGRRSIRTDLTRLPRAVSIGSDLVYMAVHETGGTFTVPRHNVRTHRRTVAFGRRVAPYVVGPFERGPYSARFPRRSWLAPAVRKVRPTMGRIFLDEMRRSLR